MVKKSLVTGLAAVVAAGALASPALASKGGGGGGTKAVLPAPPIPVGAFEGIGSGPVYIHDSFGHAQRTRYARNGSVVDVATKPEVNGIRAEFPNNQAETWIGGAGAGAAWNFAVIGPGDPFEPPTPLQVADFGAQDGNLAIEGAEPFGPDPRPNALIPFPAPATPASTVSAEIVDFDGRTAIGFTSSSATTRNFETAGQAWLELDAMGRFITGGNTGIVRWTFHTDGLSGATLSGTYQTDPSAYNRVAVSYDPVAHVAAATVNGQVVASVPYAARPIAYAGVEGTLFANVDDFTVRAGTVTDPAPGA
jgi:hypothetical protein